MWLARRVCLHRASASPEMGHVFLYVKNYLCICFWFAYWQEQAHNRWCKHRLYHFLKCFLRQQVLSHLVWTSPRQFAQIQVPMSLEQGELGDMSKNVNMTIIDMIRASNETDYSGDKLPNSTGCIKSRNQTIGWLNDSCLSTKFWAAWRWYLFLLYCLWYIQLAKWLLHYKRYSLREPPRLA